MSIEKWNLNISNLLFLLYFSRTKLIDKSSFAIFYKIYEIENKEN